MPAALMLAAGFFAAAAGCRRAEPAGQAPGSAGLVKVRFQADWIPVPAQGGFFQALARGYYKEAGLDVEILKRDGVVTQTMLVAGGRADIGIGGSDEILLAIGSDAPLQIIGTYFQNHPYGLMTYPDHPIHDFKELDGHTIMAFSGATWIPYVEKHYGIKLRITPIQQTISLFLADKTHTFIHCVFVTDEPFVAKQFGVETVTKLISDSGWNPYKVMFANTDFLKAHPAAVRAFVLASLRGWADYMRGDPRPANTLIASLNEQLDPAFLGFTREAMKTYHIVEGLPGSGQTLGAIDRGRIEREIAALHDLGLTLRTFPYERAVAESVLPAAEEIAAATR
jgi:NitT/TauT family transport system substrate-binding protein